jgi:hypothetical protein
MSLLDDARAAASGCCCYSRLEFSDCRTNPCVDDVMPKIVAALEAAEWLAAIDPGVNLWSHTGQDLCCWACDAWLAESEPHKPDCAHHALREALDA